MKNKILKDKKGFTIIEVVLVLAIAGLIFLMVFVAFPTLQTNQRDAQRRQDYANLQAAVITATSNNNGTFPSSLENTALNVNGQDPQKNSYTLTVQTGVTGVSAPVAGKVYVLQSAKCSNGAPVADSSTNNFVIYGYLESGTYCREAQLQ